MDTWLDQMNDSDREPFPLENIEDAPPLFKIMTALTLVSNVLRDSELVKDLKLKERVLRRTLLIWGKFVNLLDVDEDFAGFWRRIGNELANLLDVPEARRSKFVEDFADRPSATGLSVSFGNSFFEEAPPLAGRMFR